MADKITFAEFKEKLAKYPAMIASFSKPAKDGKSTLLELDKFRYVDAPSQFSKKVGAKTIEASDVLKLVQWKVNHGTFRPTLQSLVASNKDDKVETIISEGFTQYAKDPSDIKAVIDKFTELKGIGPATASLFLAVHDPENVIFFEDEAFRWLCQGGQKSKILYNFKEYINLLDKAKALSAKLKVTPSEIEKVAFVIIKENEPPKEAKPAKVPSGLSRGRPKIPDHLKKPEEPKSGKGRGRPPGSGTKTADAAAEKGTTKGGKEEVEEENSRKTSSRKRKGEDADSKDKALKKAKA